MKKMSLILFVGLCAILSGCSEKQESFGLGTSVYRPGFLWTDLWSDTTFVEQAFLVSTTGFDENQQNLHAEIFFTDNDGNDLDLTTYEVWVNQKHLNQPGFCLSSNSQDTLFIRIRCIPSDNVAEGRHDIIVNLRGNSNVDKADCVGFGGETAVDSYQDTLIGRLYFVYDKKCNIGNFVISIIGMVILVGIVLWFLLLQRLFYPRFSAINKTVVIPNQAPISIHFRGARMLILDNVKHKQSGWNKLWTGKIIYKQHPSITSQIIMKPTGKGKKILFIANHNNYTCIPNPISVQPSKVTDIINNQELTIN